MLNSALRDKINAAGKERTLKRERIKTDYIFRGKAKYMTRSYKKKLEEGERLKKLIEIKEKYDRKNIGNIDQFYSHVYSQLTNEKEIKFENEYKKKKILQTSLNKNINAQSDIKKIINTTVKTEKKNIFKNSLNEARKKYLRTKPKIKKLYI